MTIEEILSTFRVLKFADLIDILIVTLVVYYVLGLVYKTRAGQLAKGAIIFLIIYVIAFSAPLRTVLWVMEGIMQVGFLAVVVLFQPEIRRALEQMGQTDRWTANLFRNNQIDPTVQGKWRTAITAICDAAERLSETHTGALIVLERKTNLSEIVRTGTIIESNVNRAVLGTVFYDGTPLHDGAVVIKDGVLKAAGCVLPLSNNLDSGKDMGTRHRAALGIAENSDAITVVVSEETGIISLTKDGILIRNLDRQRLYSQLESSMIIKEPEEKKQNFIGKMLEQAFMPRQRKGGNNEQKK